MIIINIILKLKFKDIFFHDFFKFFLRVHPYVFDEKCEKDQNCQGVDYNYIYYRILSFDAKFIIN